MATTLHQRRAFVSLDSSDDWPTDKLENAAVDDDIRADGPAVDRTRFIQADGSVASANGGADSSAASRGRGRRHWLQWLTAGIVVSQYPNEPTFDYRVRFLGAVAKRHWRNAVLLLLGALATLMLLLTLQSIVAYFVLPAARFVSAASREARSALASDDLLVLHEDSFAPLNRSASFAQDTMVDSTPGVSVVRLLELVDTFFVRTNYSVPCCCAPMFGIHFNHIAVLDQERALNLFNVVDPYYEQYDTVWMPWMKEQRMSEVEHRQDALFTWRSVPHTAPHNVRVVRRDKLHVTASTRAGKRLAKVSMLESKQAFCVATCIDLIKGVHVWRRAQSQSAPLRLEQSADVERVFALLVDK